MPEDVSLSIDGVELTVPPNVSVAAAVLLANISRFRTSTAGKPRGPLCGMGVCFECRVSIDGRPNCRSCQIAVRPDMRIETT